MLCRDNRSCVHSTTLRSNAVGQTQNQQRSTRAQRRSRTRAAVICTGIWITCRQITSARRRWRLDNPNPTVQLWPMYKEINRLHMQPSHNSGPYTHSVRGGDTGHTEHRNPRDRKKRRRMRAPTSLTWRARRSERPHERPARAADLLAKHINTFPAPGTPITGRTDAVVHEIDTGSTRPIRCNPRKLSPKKIKIQQELVDKMLEEGQIVHSVSAWSAPTVLVTKKDGTTRFCMDYRRLNACTKKDAFPLPCIDDSLNSLSGQAWFSTLDLASGYWQVRLSEDAKPKTAFATHSGLFQFAVMPFGLCNAPATFERLMSQVMCGLHWKRCLVYIDDILVFGNDFESALHSLELVLNRIAEYGLQLKSMKCNLFRTSVPFLGHIVGAQAWNATRPNYLLWLIGFLLARSKGCASS